MDGRRTETTFCRICESLCGLKVDLKGNEVIGIRPDNEHVATRGFACPKGLKQHRLFGTDDRLRYPMKRVGDKWGRVKWDEAYRDIGQKVRELVKEYGPNAVAMYVGTAAGFGVLHPIFAQGFMDGIGSSNLYSSASQDCANKFAVAQRMYGHPFTQPFPDLQHSRCLIIVGANPVVSKWSFLQVPNPSLHLKEMKRRGCRIIVVDPRKTETAKVAGEHVFIKPNTDPFFYLSFLNELNLKGGIDSEISDQYGKNTQFVLDLASKWPARRTAALTGISEDKLKEIVDTFVRADGASIYSSTGVNMGSHGSISFWIQECINFLSGNLDRKGGSIVGRGIIDFPRFGVKNGILLRPDRSRIGNCHSTNDAFPGGLLADEILMKGSGQIKALFVTGGNPLVTMANSNRLKKAFKSLDLLVTLDIYPNETGTVGHFMLPCTSPLERPDLPFIFPLMLGMQTKPYLQATRAVVKPDAEQMDEATIYYNLARACGVSLFGSKWAQWILNAAVMIRRQKTIPQEFLLNLLLRLSGQMSFKKLLKRPPGTLRKPHRTLDFLSERVYTSDGKVDLAPELLMEEANKLDDFFVKELSNRSYKLITKRQVTTHNSWTHNIEEFIAGDRYSNYAYLHPDDAEDLGVGFKDLVDVSTSTGSVRIPVKISSDLLRGTVAIPHGWGHQDSLMKVARTTTGVNVNILAADGLDNIEHVSGMSQLTGLDVRIVRASGPLHHTWTGYPEEQEAPANDHPGKRS